MAEGSAKARSVSINPITDPVQHSEGPFWHTNTQELYFVDTFNGTLCRWSYKDKKTQSYHLENHDSVGVIIPIKDKKDYFLVAADRNVYNLYWPSDDNENEAKLEHLITVDESKPKNQFNDGKADSKGRLWLGTLTRNGDLSVAPEGGSLYKISGFGDSLMAEEMERSLSISNGLDWCPEYKKLYHIDSQTRKIVAYDFDEQSGQIQNKKIIFDMADHPNLEGIPDGMTADGSGNLWIALFGGSAIIKIDPNKSILLETIEMPVKYCTSVCFGGPDSANLFVTTSRLKLNEKEVSETPNAGSVFAISYLGVKGRIVHEAII
ncbi:unnamed protein product [Acanthoscelides obtectus]|uniref:SMP-30/Gluconolactonase/LRE-like region domain-containing protein n=1 Tax=Acanthoscelides obtectus TaxID=200917 RepID=A0A9P0KJT8_ACAOB|nr:unnamed protein product [Acanthoscelides obtectus]CAK1665225.1 Regucalcin [Acanthoscelides obtectus]